MAVAVLDAGNAVDDATHSRYCVLGGCLVKGEHCVQPEHCPLPSLERHAVEPYFVLPNNQALFGARGFVLVVPSQGDWTEKQVETLDLAPAL